MFGEIRISAAEKNETALKRRLRKNRRTGLRCSFRSFQTVVNVLFDGKDHSVPDDLLNPIFHASDNAESPT